MFIMELKLVDFDMAEYVSNLSIHKVGSLGYVAPEILEDNQVQTSKVDIYSIGVLMNILLLSHPLYDYTENK